MNSMKASYGAQQAQASGQVYVGEQECTTSSVNALSARLNRIEDIINQLQSTDEILSGARSRLVGDYPRVGVESHPVPAPSGFVSLLDSKIDHLQEIAGRLRSAAFEFGEVLT